MFWKLNSSALSNFDMEKKVPGGWLGLLTACSATYVSLRLYECYHNRSQMSKTKRKIWDRQEKRRQNVEELRVKLTSKHINFDCAIPDLDFKELQVMLRSGRLTAYEVLLAYQSKALQVHDRLNCVTEFLDDAEARARELDQLAPEDRGPLHGIPISLKESTGLAGRDVTGGLAMFIGEDYEEDSVLVKVLVQQGAVPFVRTNLSQGLASIESSNPIFGTTSNPYDPKRSPGGSSSGEGALIGGGGSILGVGCDMAGSNRVPSSFCGIAGFKCTPDRLSNAGNIAVGVSIGLISEVYSPMGRNVDSLVEFLKATLVPSLYQLDPLLPRMPWNNTLYEDTKPMRIGYYTWDGGAESVPSVERAVLKAKAKLEAKGHTLVEFQPPDVLYVFEQFLRVFGGDHGKHSLEYIKHDEVDPCIYQLVSSYRNPLPSFVKNLMVRLIPRLHPLIKIMITHTWPRNVYDWWDLNEDLMSYKRKFTKQMRDQGVTCLICPVLPFPAFPIDNAELNFASLTYTSLYNILAFPCGSVPTTTVTHEDEKRMDGYPDTTDLHRFIHQITKGSEGLPVGVQCVGLPFEEETVLRLMKELESCL